MPPKQSVRGQVAVEYLKKHPKMPLLTLAKLMHKEQPKLFPEIEGTRMMLRGYVGSAGKEKNPSGGRRTVNPDKYGTRRKKGVSGEDAWQSLMPESRANVIEPWIVPTSVRRVLVLSDIHCPFHDSEALRIAIEYGISQKPDMVLLNGDTMDMYSVSDHQKDPRKRDFASEIEAGRELMKMLRSAFPGVPIAYRAGNHCFRLERYLMKYAEILLGFPEFELPVLLKMGEHGITYIEHNRPMHVGRLTILHGDEYRGGGGINPARWLSLRAGESALIGHFHRTSSHVSRSVRGSVQGWWSTGCLCELAPEYLILNQWQHGFAVVDVNPDGSFEVDNKMIVNGRVR